MALKTLAKNNLLALQQNPYPGRGIIVGLDESGKHLIQVYWIMGRSENSRNRIFVTEDNGILKTAAFDPAKVKDPSLIIYTAMAQTNTRYAVSNGAQTLDALSEGLNALTDKWKYEPDQPNYTPRISALIEPKSFNKRTAELSLLKKSPFSSECNAYLYKLDISHPGFGYCITTYNEDGDPLPSFTGDPYLLPLAGDIENVAQTIWDSLNADNKVALAVKFIKIDTFVYVHKTLIAIRNIHQGD